MDKGEDGEDLAPTPGRRLRRLTSLALLLRVWIDQGAGGAAPRGLIETE